MGSGEGGGLWWLAFVNFAFHSECDGKTVFRVVLFFHPQVDPGLAVNRGASGPSLTWRLHFTVAELRERSGLFSLFAKFSNPDIS